ncbi:unnamed protein product [Linum tenue]|uniref:Uncharacterized protein n=1 Tax=Linum tenue TaxID=586396 RepID=A0AAV0RF16_9ROSI|nr:unnamed protein product [Linum tenue]
MFYSQTFLARKGPLGTVWCAAHLQHRLKKSHYTSTDIKAVVDHIMCPEVPIALRMSGHLLLGVARIYSKKVDYLFQDCNLMKLSLRNAFTITVDINLPENAKTAKPDAVTLPQTFDLDALEIDDDIHNIYGSPDSHCKTREEITLDDQIPTGREPFVAVTFDEDITMDDTSQQDLARDLGVRPVVEDSDRDENNHRGGGPSNDTEMLTEPADFGDVGPSNDTEMLTEPVEFGDVGPSNQTEVPTQATGLEDPGPNNQTEVLTGSAAASQGTDSRDHTVMDDVLTENVEPGQVEKIRDARDSSPRRAPLVSPDMEKDDAADRNRLREKDLLESGINIRIPEEPSSSGVHSFRLRPHSEPPTSAVSGGSGLFLDENMSPGQATPGLAMVVAPSPVQQPQRRARRRNYFFDHATVLTNKFVKKGLNDCTDLLRKKRAPPSALSVWKLSKKSRKEQVFHEPLITGLSPDISTYFAADHSFANRHPIPQLEDIAEPSGPSSPIQSTAVDVNPEPTVPNSPPVIQPISPRNVHSQSKAPSVDPTTTTVEPTNGKSANPEANDTDTGMDMDIDIDIERVRDDGGGHHSNDDVLNEFSMNSPVQYGPFPRQDALTPSPKHVHSTTVRDGAGNTGASDMLHTATDFAASTSTFSSGLRTPRMFGEDTQLSNILEVMDSPESEGRYSSGGDNTPAPGFYKVGSQGIHQLSGRTRAVAQYLERQSPNTPTLGEDQTRDISLNKLLEGKTRTVCARMFFETLVLKSHGVVDVEREKEQGRVRLKLDVEQEEPYGDVHLKLTRLAT